MESETKIMVASDKEQLLDDLIHLVEELDEEQIREIVVFIHGIRFAGIGRK